MRRAGVVALGASAVAAAPVAAAGLLAAEWKLAKRGPQLASVDFPVDGRVGGDGPAPRLLWLGDSLVTGAGATSLDACLPRVTARGLDRRVELIIRAVAGSRVQQVADEQAPLAADLGPDAVVVCIGSNDVLYRTRLADLRRDYHRLLDTLPEGVPVLCIGPADFGAVVRLPQPLRALTAFMGRRISATIRETATEAGAAYLDMAAATGPAMRREPDRLLSVDRFHPSDAGYALMAEAVLPCLRELLGRVEERAADRAREVRGGDR